MVAPGAGVAPAVCSVEDDRVTLQDHHQSCPRASEKDRLNDKPSTKTSQYSIKYRRSPYERPNIYAGRLFVDLSQPSYTIGKLLIRVWTPLSTEINSFFFSWLPHDWIDLTESAAFVYPAFISGGRTTGP